MAVLVPTDWQHPTRDPPMDPPNAPRQQRSSPANDHSSVQQQAQPHPSAQQQQLMMSQQQSLMSQSPYTFPAQQQPQGGWTPSINATPFYPSFYQPQLQQQPGQPFGAQLPPPAAYIDQANAQLAQWAYQQMIFNAQHGFPPAMPPQHQPRPAGPIPSPTDYFAQSPFSAFPSGTPPPNAQRGGAGDHPVPYPGFHPYRRPARQQSHSTNTSDAGDWRSGPTINHPPHAPYMRPDASASTSSVNSNSSQRQRTNSNQSGHSGHSVPANHPPPANRSRSNTASSAASSSARNTPPPPRSDSPSSIQRNNPHHRNGSSSSASSTATSTSTRPPGISPSVPTTATSPATTSTSSSSSAPSPVPRLTRPSPLSQGNFTAAEKRMSRDDSDLAAMMSTQPSAIPSRSGGLKGRLRRALSFNPTQTLKEEDMEQDDDTSIKASALNGASSSKLKGKAAATDPAKSPSVNSPLPDDASSTATIQTKKKGRAASLFNARFNASTDNISLSSTVSSASVMIRKLGSLGNLARRNSLAGITSLFKDKDKDKEGGDKDKKKKSKKGAKAEASIASVSHVTAELDRSNDWTVGTDMNGLTPAAKLARQHTLKSNAEAAARAKEKAEREASAAAATAANDALAKANAAAAASRVRAGGSNGTGANGTAGVPTWDKNTQTRNGAVSPRSGSIKIAEDGTRVLLEDDDDESEDGHYGSSHGHQYYNAEGWEDDEEWEGEGGEIEEDVTIRQGLQRTSLDDGNDVEPWAMDVRRSVERAKIPARGILKYAGTYDQSSYLASAPQVRARSNSYNSPASPSEVGPLAHVPSTDPDHIDGIHRNNLSQHEAANASDSAPTIPSLPTLAFDSRISMSFVTGSKELKEIKDLPDPPASSLNNLTSFETTAGNRMSAIFQNPTFNSSAPVLSTFNPTAPVLPHRSATTPQKRLTFATSLAVYDTFSPSMYDRRSEPATWSRLTPALAQRIKEELNSYKMEEMEVHASSRMHTQFFV